MAGDWIKMRVDLLTSPKVVRMSAGLNKDRLQIIGGLFSVWSIFDAHSEDGVLDGYTPDTLDKIIFFDGFSDQMASVGWLIVSDNSLSMPRFDSHNGKSAKNRAMDAERKRAARKVQDLSGNEPDKNTTREEKSRVENIKDKDILAGKPAKANNKKKLPDDFVLTETLRDNAIAYWHSKNRKDLSASEQWLKFINHHRSKGSKMADWDCAWVTWYTNAVEFTKPPGGGNYPDFSPTVKR